MSGKLNAFSEKTRDILDRALSVNRNSAGSLDLGVDQLNAAAQAQMQRATAAREVYEATVRAAQAEGLYSQETRQAIQATKALWQEEERASQAAQAHARAASLVQQELNRQKSATDLVQQATRKGTTEQQNVINSIRASRTAYVQLGQQLQDVVVQAQLGTNAFLIFAQQAPQAAFALSGLERSANATQASIGRFATFLSGPWGAAIFAATAILGPFVAKLFESGEAADKSAGAMELLTDRLDLSRNSYASLTAVVEEYNKAQDRSTALTYAAIIATERKAAAILKEAKAELARLQATPASSFGEVSGASMGIPGVVVTGDQLKQTNISRVEAAIAAAEKELASAGVAAGTERIKRATDERYNIEIGFSEQQARLDERRKRNLIDQTTYERELLKVTQQKDAALKAYDQSQKKDRPSKPDTSAARAAERLENFGDRAAESIARINERFDEQPRLIDQAAQATRQLDALIADLAERKPPNFEQTIASAETAKRTVEEALVRPLEDMARESERRLQIAELLAAGQEAEAAQLQAIWALESQLGTEEALRAQVQQLITDGRKDEAAALAKLLAMYPDMKQEVADVAAHEYARTKELEKQRDLLGAYLSTTQSIRGELEGIFSGEGSIANFGKIFSNLQSKVLVDKIFGPALEELDQFVKGEFGVKSANDFLASETKRAGGAASDFADALAVATEKVLNPSATTAMTFEQEFGPAFVESLKAAGTVPANDNGNAIVVEGSVMSLTPEQYFEQLTRKIVAPALDGLNEIFGVKFFTSLQGVMSGALYGYSTAGDVGAILGALKGIEGLPEGITDALDVALKGAQTGTMVSGLAGAFGIELGQTGSQIGGALGALTGIPGGDIIGAIAGGILEKILGGIKKGTVTINGADITSTYGGNDDRIQAATTGANSVLDSIERIAEALGADVNSAAGAVSIGIRKDSWRVDPTGRNLTKIEDGAIDFGQDQAAAIRYAIMDLIKDGVIDGLTASEERLLMLGDDLEKSLQKVLDFQSVFTRLKAYKDPVGAAIDEVEKEFDRLREIFAEAGASAEEYAQLEELYGIERAKAIEEATQAVVGSMQSLLDDLTVNNSALSLRERESLAKAEYDALAARVAAGDTTAYDDFADAARTLLEIEREIYGSQQPYFDLLNEVTTLTRTALEAAENRSDPSSTSAVPVNDNSAIVSGIDTTNSQLAAVNQNIGATNVRLDNLTALLASGSGSAKVSNF
ncbi:phage tail length tape measure family protein [Erythrobacter sp. SG61-1L]|uniref:phage tail length tape measure family protein n=1 Tax=Erythrobacter sp. SG61-1L TaxID=1603897 RepID=UPI00138F8395|nr:phage tail length tape measure family protein [Erythrobacter sp. SG61-1L]